VNKYGKQLELSITLSGLRLSKLESIDLSIICEYETMPRALFQVIFVIDFSV
jgi:hypothetical protein